MVDDDRFSGWVAAFGLGESYMDGRWGCDSINAFIDRALRAKFSTVNL